MAAIAPKTSERIFVMLWTICMTLQASRGRHGTSIQLDRRGRLRSIHGPLERASALQFLSLTGVKSPADVLDVACGTGVLAKVLAEAGARVVGIDASEGYLEGARRRRFHPNITYELGDVRHLRFETGIFEAALSTLALDVIPEIKQVIAEMKRVTRPGAVVASS